MISSIKTLWRRRNLIRALTTSNLKLVHRNTLLGYVWWLLDPIMMTAVYAIVVGILLGRGRSREAYPAFIMCGIIAWKSFAGTVSQSIDAIARSEPLIKSFNFPKAVLPISIVLSNHFLFAFALIPLVALCGFYQLSRPDGIIQVTWTVAYIPLIFVAQISLALGGALLFSCFGVFFRDLGNIMTHVLRVGWYLSPGLYSITNIIKGYEGLLSIEEFSGRSLYVLNPFAHIMEGYRSAILYGRPPDLAGIGMAFVIGIVTIIVGLRVFQSQERKFTKLV